MRSNVTTVSYLHSSVIDTAVHVITVLLAQLWKSEWCYWHRYYSCAFYSSVNDTAVQCAAESDFCIKNSVSDHFQKIFNKVGCTALSLTQKWYAQRHNWHSCDMYSSVIETAVTCKAVSKLTPLCSQLCLFFMRIRSHIQKGFNTCIRGLGGDVWWEKNQRSKISCQGPFKGK
jgi:hypothetical protein